MGARCTLRQAARDFAPILRAMEEEYNQREAERAALESAGDPAPSVPDGAEK